MTNLTPCPKCGKAVSDTCYMCPRCLSLFASRNENSTKLKTTLLAAGALAVVMINPAAAISGGLMGGLFGSSNRKGHNKLKAYSDSISAIDCVQISETDFILVSPENFIYCNAYQANFQTYNIIPRNEITGVKDVTHEYQAHLKKTRPVVKCGVPPDRHPDDLWTSLVIDTENSDLVAAVVHDKILEYILKE